MAVSPPRPQLPPLNALRAFEAAARNGGFTSAAEELGVTVGAVSQQVRLLEEWAGVALFERRSRGVRLTQHGTHVASGMTRAFDSLGAAVAELRVGTEAPAVTLATLPSIAQLWLPRRLGNLRAAVGNRAVSVTALEKPPNMRRESYDLSLFFQAGDVGDHLEPELIFPVCAPSLAARIQSPEDLTAQTRLHDASWSDDWRSWTEQLGVSLPEPDSGPRYSLYSLVLAEAKAGAGIAIGHSPLVQEALADGSLVRPLLHSERFAERRHKDALGTGRGLNLELSARFTSSEASVIRAAFE